MKKLIILCMTLVMAIAVTACSSPASAEVLMSDKGRIDSPDVSGGDLPLLLSAAVALLQPSRYEGFALPLLEAMAVGVPGVVSDSSCLPEVSGGIWPIAGQDDPTAFAAGMDRVALDPAARATAIEAGLEITRNGIVGSLRRPRHPVRGHGPGAQFSQHLFPNSCIFANVFRIDILQ